MITYIDADSILYRVGFALEKEDEYSAKWMVSYNIDSIINNIINKTQASDYMAYIGGKGNFRDTLAKIVPYKANRKSKQKPKYYQQARDYLLSTYNTTVVDGMEADDAVGIAQWEVYSKLLGQWNDLSSTIAHIDKDINMIPGLHYNYKRDESYYISEELADKNYWLQVLTGDWACDGIPGLKGVGIKTAEKILEGAGTWEELQDKVKWYYHNQAKVMARPDDRVVFETQLQGGITVNHNGAYDVFDEIKQLIWVLREPLNV